MTGTTTEQIKRLQSKDAKHYDDGPTVTIKHRHPLSGAELSSTGRLIAETTHEVALLVRSTPEVIPTSAILYRSDVVGGCGACGSAEPHGDDEVCDLDDAANRVIEYLDRALENDAASGKAQPGARAKDDIQRLCGVTMFDLSNRLLGDSVRGVDGVLLRAGLVERVHLGHAVRYRRTRPAERVIEVVRESPTSSWWIVRIDGTLAGAFVKCGPRTWRSTRAKVDHQRSVTSQPFHTRRDAIAYITDPS